jgi:GDP-L-fucose synthase
MVVPSLIRKAQENDVLDVFGDGSPIRDFIYAEDVAEGMIFTVENKITEPVNLGSGEGNSIKELVELVIKHSGKDIDVKWYTDVPSGDKQRLMSMNKMNEYGFKSHTSLEEGVKKTTEWFLNNRDILDKRYNPFVNH